jgi:hypothetical protein
MGQSAAASSVLRQVVVHGGQTKPSVVGRAIMRSSSFKLPLERSSGHLFLGADFLCDRCDLFCFVLRIAYNPEIVGQKTSSPIAPHNFVT